MRKALGSILALLASLATAQAQPTVPDSSVGGIFLATPPTYSDRQVGIFQIDANGNLKITGGGASAPIFVTGNVASGATDSGNPVKIGGKYNAPAPTFTDGQRGDIQIGPRGSMFVTNEGRLTTYSAGRNNNTPAANTTDFLIIPGSSTKTVKLRKLVISFQATAAQGARGFLYKCSAAGSGGTTANLTSVPHDSTNAAATVTPFVYTANPAGICTQVGAIAQPLITWTAANAAQEKFVYDAAILNTQPVILRGAAEQIAFNLNGAAVPAGGVVQVEQITWTEE